jgi:hypothetical protein
MMTIVKEDTLMFYCVSIKQVKKAVMLSALLMFSTFLQAESSANVESSESAAKAETGLKPAADQQRDFIFPDWPKRKQSNRQMIPPAPPGPYMSSALTDFSVGGLSFGSNPVSSESNKTVSASDPSNVPMSTFSPDRPWLDHAYRKHKYDSDCPPACSPQRWMPENGYQYAPLVNKKLYPVVPNRIPGRQSMPDMKWPPSSRLPSMGSTANGAYPYAPNYAPRYNAPSN